MSASDTNLVLFGSVDSSTSILDLRNRDLTALPPEIGRFTSLRELWLDGNQLSALPPEIGRLTSLQVLRLRKNQLSALPPEIGQLTSLHVLRVGGNQLKVLPPELGRLTWLQELDVHGNPLNPELQAAATSGLHELRAFLVRLAAEGEPLYEAKLILVGE